MMFSLTFGNAKFVLVCVVILLAFAAVQPCAADLWSGSNANGYYSWSNGSSTDDLFGTPESDTQNTMIFSPWNFEAISFGGETTISSTLEFELLAGDGYAFKNITMSESGVYAIEDASIVNASGTLLIENLDTGNSLPDAQLSFTLDLPDPDAWIGSAQVSIPLANWTHIKVTFINTLSATAEDGSFASIANTASGATISIQIPEPATICILGVSALSLIRRKINK